MKPTWAVPLLCCIVGSLCVEDDSIGKHSQNVKSRPSLGIYGGSKTSISKYPCMVSIKSSGTLVGSGVILNSRWVLTTGYTVAWVESTTLELRVGSSYYDKQGQTLKASRVIAHPNFTGSWDWDIAVVKTDEPIKLGENVKPIKLGKGKLEGGTKGWTAGWGEYDSTGNPSEVMRNAQVTVYDWKKCEEEYGDYLTERLICTLDKEVAPCMYDFGDPVIIKQAVYGLFAGGNGCRPNPILHVNVPALRSWVIHAMKSEEDSHN